MTGFWNPEFWNGIGIVGLVLMIGFLFLLSLQRGWLILGIHHREIMDAKDRENMALMERSRKDAESISTLSLAVTKQTATEDAVTKILAALRETIAAGGGH
ncbi:membrane protein [Mycobacterium phage MooMoo]|uniref:Membrane protein n=1 Tax=Mycobacterium phage MooMoo TaxID=2108127 RepID=A0A2P1JR71_9CAUD|nr:membrane protein [Mycobacterium phage MooMoo]AVO21637.1 membrane protein [Mycobacterium phage MooMoo]